MEDNTPSPVGALILLAILLGLFTLGAFAAVQAHEPTVNIPATPAPAVSLKE